MTPRDCRSLSVPPNLRRRLLVPLLRLRHRPEHAARGTLVGLAWAFTLTFGIRMPLVLLTWVLARRLAGWDFSLILGLAWTWTTNILVTPALYGLFFVTGRILRGHWRDPAGLAAFREQAQRLTERNADLSERLSLASDLLLCEWGPTLWLGALPWSFLMAGLGYAGVRHFLRRHAARRRNLICARPLA